jgi:hypothetical protein
MDESSFTLDLGHRVIAKGTHPLSCYFQKKLFVGGYMELKFCLVRHSAIS